jgi:hypothetical protein
VTQKQRFLHFGVRMTFGSLRNTSSRLTRSVALALLAISSTPSFSQSCSGGYCPPVVVVGAAGFSQGGGNGGSAFYGWTWDTSSQQWDWGWIDEAPEEAVLPDQPATPPLAPEGSCTELRFSYNYGACPSYEPHYYQAWNFMGGSEDRVGFFDYVDRVIYATVHLSSWNDCLNLGGENCGVELVQGRSAACETALNEAGVIDQCFQILEHFPNFDCHPVIVDFISTCSSALDAPLTPVITATPHNAEVVATTRMCREQKQLIDARCNQ